MSPRPDKHTYFLGLLDKVAERATCPRRQVACIFVDEDYHILSTGYNGPPKAFPHCIDKPCPGVGEASGTTDKCQAVHAEQNAILQCKDLDKVYAVYTSASPCFVCTKMMLNLKNLRWVIAKDIYPDERALDMWADTMRLIHAQSNGTFRRLTPRLLLPGSGTAWQPAITAIAGFETQSNRLGLRNNR